MRKAKLSVHGADVKNVLRSFSIDVAADRLEDLEEVSDCFSVSFLNENRFESLTDFSCFFFRL